MSLLIAPPEEIERCLDSARHDNPQGRVGSSPSAGNEFSIDLRRLTLSTTTYRSYLLRSSGKKRFQTDS
jgi:hypothetical protein